MRSHTIVRVVIVAALLLARGDAFGADPAPAKEPPAAKPWDLSGHEKRYSLGNEELIVRKFFHNRRGGFFVDVGCFHWKKSSNTYFLEAHLGWSGIGIDALDSLREGYEKNRKATRFFHYAVSDESGGVLELHAAGALSTTDGDRLDAFPRTKEREARVIQVPTITLDDLLDQAGVEEIDFLSIDIEGAEVGALRGFDIDRFQPKLVCIEVAPENRQAVAEYFEAAGYLMLERYRAYDPVNWWYARVPKL